jgi:hypothetical protein
MNRKKIFTSRKIFLLNCPSCGKVGNIHKSKSRTIKENLLKYLFFFGYFRCWECDWRGILVKRAVIKQSLKLLFFYFIIAVCSSFVALAIIKNMIG